MTLSADTRLGPYEITAKLGEGGMGVVFRAKDVHLGREVALKVLPEGFTADPERLARFEREAKVLGSLNHPNIAQIHGLEVSGETRALVMELVEGPTLAERLEHGALPLEESLAIARQIAAALEEAHGKGIVHRDLKPQNVKAPMEGSVKVLDFGLAKAMDPVDTAAGSASRLAHSPTLTLGATMQGVILGSAAYMAPEQAKGTAVDKRADIWAFGVVLYEMLTGKRLFDAPTVPETLAQVLTRAPDLAELPASTPAAIRRLLRRCLERDPRNRLHDIADARIVLDELATGRVEEPGAAASPTLLARRRSTSWVAAGLAIAAAAGGVAGWLLRRPASAPTTGDRWALAIPDGLTISSAEYPQVAMSRDGRLQVVVVVDSAAVPRLLLRSGDEFAARVLSDTERALAPFFSPDGAWIGFFRDNALHKIPVAGGPPIRLAATSGQVRGGTWSRDGFIYFAPDTTVPLSRVSENGGAVEPVTQLDDVRNERTHRWPEALPDGSAVLFTSDDIASTEYYDDARIEAVRPATGERKVLIEGSSQARYAPSGHLVFARGGALFAVRFDARSLVTSGSPVQVAQGVATDVGSGAVEFSLSENGGAVWVPGGTSVSYELVWVDREGAETSAAIPPAPYNELALSPEGGRVALTGGQGGVADLWVADLERRALTRLTFGEFASSPVWSPDGARIVYGTRLQGAGRANTWQIAWKPADGSREAEVLVEGERPHQPTGFSPDGRTLIYDAMDTQALRRDLWALPLDGPRQPRPLVAGPFMKDGGVVSPDGRWLAYVSDESGQDGVYVRPFPAGDGRWQISAPQGVEPSWSHDGSELFYRAEGSLYAVRIDTTRGFSASRPERLFDRVGSGGLANTYGPAPDGRRFFTFRSPEGVGSLRTLYLDLGFGRRLTAATETRR